MSATKYAVRCDDFTTKPLGSREAAERRREQIENDGNCQLVHEIVEVER